MSPLVRRYLKTAIAFLLVGIVVGGVALVRRELFSVYPSAALVSAHTHVILVGFVMDDSRCRAVDVPSTTPGQ